ncbi:MAG: hypothetical protein K0S61_713 [Anaerocolumna sp.]|jgi:predicted phosphoribosyltransferase|nr:hypothetical protein [Anaerocolumna sp.]
MNDEIERSMYIAEDQIQSAKRRAIRELESKSEVKEHKPLTLFHVVLIGIYLGLYAFILVQIMKGGNVSLKTATDFFERYLK